MNQAEADKIIAAVCTEFGVTPDDLRGRRKHGAISRAREVCCYLVHGLSDDDVARIVGVHRTTVGKARKRVAAKLKATRGRFRRQIQELSRAGQGEKNTV